MPAFDPFKGYASNPYPVYDNSLEVVPSDTDELPVVATTLYVETGQNPATGAMVDVSVTTAGGQRYVIKALDGPIWFPVRVRKVWATGTTAKSVIALW